MSRDAVNAMRQIAKDELPRLPELGTVRRVTGDLADVQLDASNRYLRDVPSIRGANLVVGDRVLMLRTTIEPRWVVIGALSSSSSGSPTTQGVKPVQTPETPTVSVRGMYLEVIWEASKSSEVLAYELEHNSSASETGCTVVTLHDNQYLYHNSAGTARYFRVRAIGTNFARSGWSAWANDTVARHDPEDVDDHSADVAEMQETTDPGEAGSESLATDLTGEIKRLRGMWAKLRADSLQWYETINYLSLTGDFDSGVYSDIDSNPRDGQWYWATDTHTLYAGHACTWYDVGSSGTTFLGLTDTPNSYAGEALKFPSVNAGEDALEFRDLTLGDISDLLSGEISDFLDHDELGGLADDDHTQYVLADGTREMSADWNMGSYNLGLGRAPTAHLDIYDGGIETTETYYGLLVEHKKTAGVTDGTDSLYGVQSLLEFDQAGGVLGPIRGLHGFATLTDGTALELSGLLGYSYIAGGEVTSNAMGVYAYLQQTAGTADDLYGIRGVISTAGAGTIGGSIYGAHVRVDSAVDPGESAYVLYVDAATNVDYGVYQAGSVDNYFAGTMTITGLLTLSAGALMGDTLDMDTNRIDFDADNDTSIRASADDVLTIEVSGSDDFAFKTTGLEVTNKVTASNFESTVAAGTAPFVVASNTKVTNLNADLLDGMNSADASTPDTIVSRDAAGDITADTFHQDNPVDVSSGVTKILVETGNTGEIKHGNFASMQAFLASVLQQLAYDNSAAVTNITTTYQTITQASFTVPTGATYDIICLGLATAWGNNARDQFIRARFYRDAAAIGPAPTTGGAANDRQSLVCMAVDAGVTAGTYTYYLKMQSINAADTVTIGGTVPTIFVGVRR